MKKYCFFSVLHVFFLLEYENIYCQNIVYNSGFEVINKCPDSLDNIHVARGWRSPTKHGTPDYYNSCDTNVSKLQGSLTFNKVLFGIPQNYAGYQESKSNGYAGLYLIHHNFFSREYIQGRLNEPLKKGEVYRVSCKVSLAESSFYSMDRLSFGFSRTKNIRTKKVKQYYDSYVQKSLLDVVKTKRFITVKSDKMLECMTEWVDIQGEYKARGGERYITIGIFENTMLESQWMGLLGFKPIKITNSLKKYSLAEISDMYPDYMGDKFSYYYIDDVKVEMVR